MVKGHWVFAMCMFLLNSGALASGEGKHWLVITSYAPPAILYVQDSEGRRTGTDPSSVLSPDGMGGIALREIPNSNVEDINIDNDIPGMEGQGQPTTSYHISVYNGGAQSYLINVHGIADGSLRIDAITGPKRTVGRLVSQTWMLCKAGMDSKVMLDFDPNAKTLQARRIVTANELAGGINIACNLGLLSPDGICRSFRAKADAIAKSLGKGNKEAAKGELGAFLNELKAQESKKHIKEPALSILREEAEALLKGIEEGTVQAGAVTGKKKKPWWWPF